MGLSFKRCWGRRAEYEVDCWLRVLALSTSALNVFSFAFKDDMPLLSCLECFNREYGFLVMTLVGLVRSSVSGFMVERLFLTVPRGCLQFVIVVFPDHTHLLFFIPRISPKISDTLRTK